MNARPLMMEKLRECRASHDRQRSYVLRNWDKARGFWDLAECWERDGKGRTANASLETYGMSMALHLGPADSFKDLEPVLVGLLEQGWEADGVTDDGYTRDYRFKWDHGTLVVVCWPHSASGKCKRVLVGVETNEVEKYKLVCEEEPAEGVDHATAGTPT